MNKGLGLLGLTISGYFLIGIVMNMIKPGVDSGYTRMLVYAWLSTIPLSFFLVMTGGGRVLKMWAAMKPLFVGGFSDKVMGFLFLLLIIGLPFIMLWGIWKGLGLRYGALFIGYFLPLILHVAFGRPEDVVIEFFIYRGLLFFAAAIAGVGLVHLLGWMSIDLGRQSQNFLSVWPNYSSELEMFFTVYLFALFNQLIDFSAHLKWLIGE
jgi:hypothetical protein